MAEVVDVVLKWNNKKFKIAVDKKESLDLFKAQIFALTNVPIDRQKILIKGKQLKKSKQLKSLKKGQKLMMMGSADATVPKQDKIYIFEEDLPENEKARLIDILPSGLKNIGNTCYMNSSIQLLRAIPELKDISKRYSTNPSDFNNVNAVGHQLVSSFGRLSSVMDNSVKSVVPFEFHGAMGSQFPQFVEAKEGHLMQQDADECLSQLLYTLQSRLNPTDNRVNSFFSLINGEMESTIKLAEEEQKNGENENNTNTSIEEVKTHSFNKLRCHITINTNFLKEGIASGLVENIEKFNSATQQNAIYTKTDRISKLPKYLFVQFVRFFWRSDTQKKAKILRKVVYPENLDVHEFCTEDLQNKISSYRDKVDAEFEKKQLEKDKMNAEPEKKETEADDGGEKDMDIDDLPGKDVDMINENKESLEKQDRDYLNSGKYKLCGVITHQGRNANSGHYIGWTRDESNDKQWFKYDDAVVTKHTTDEIKALSGGGDWHMAYILLYRSTSWRGE